MSAFDQLAAIPALAIWEGVVARAVDGERMTLAVVELEPDAEVAEHSHDNEQLGIVLHGSMTLRVHAEERELAPGGTYRIDSNLPHAARAGAAGAVVIDVFAPARADWDSAERIEPRPARWP
jgi:quercetin dioxygenase-like cupin family protein